MQETTMTSDTLSKVADAEGFMINKSVLPDPRPEARADFVELSVIVPTYNESENIAPLYAKLKDALAGVNWEMVVVDDDSPDGTANSVRTFSKTHANVRVVHRIARRGLSTAVIEGMLATSAPYLAVIDADMQHDERLLPQMLEELRSGEFDIVNGSRYMAGGGVGEWSSGRQKMSVFATRVAKLILKADLTDPMSGFFMITRDAFDQTVRRLSGEGYKILLDLFASTPKPFRFKELPYEFRPRQFGESKVDTLVLWEYAALIIDKLVGHIVPARLIMFAAIGGSGVAVHFAAFSLAFFLAGASFMVAQTIGTVIAMTSNYILNNILTYRDKRKRGKDFFIGMAIFYLVCGIGVIGNVGVASMMFERNINWLISSLAGIAIGIVWNYSASSIFIWERKKSG